METWKDICGWPHYEVSSEGRARSKDREIVFADGRKRRYLSHELSQYEDGFGYKKVTLKANGDNLRAHVHVLVAEAFIGARPLGFMTLHSDGNAANNRADNLRYGTAQENHDDSLRHGTRRFGERAHNAKLTEGQVAEIKKLKGKHTCRELADMFGTSPANVCNIQQGKRWVRHA